MADTYRPTLNRTLHAFGRSIEIGAVALGGVGVFAIMFQTMGNAITRYAFGRPVELTVELVAGYYLPLVAMAGILLAYIHNEHASADVIDDGLSRRGKTLIATTASALTFLLSLSITIATYEEAVHAVEIGQTYGVSSLPIWPAKLLLPLGFGLLSVLSGVAVFTDLRRRPRPWGATPLNDDTKAGDLS